MTQVLIDRELLERLEHVTRNLVPHLQCHADLVDALASPRQPDGEVEGLEVVAWQDADNPLYTTGERRQMHGWATDGYPIVELCRLSDAKRAIAELREELDAAGEIQAQQGRRNTELRAERDTLRQQRDTLAAELAAIKGQDVDCDRSACGDFSPGRCDNPDCSARRDRKPALPAAPEGGEV